MMEEDKLRKHFGKNEPFKVPDAYFDSFADRLQLRIQQLPQAEKPAKRTIRLVPRAWFAAAASVAIVATLGLTLMIPKWKTGSDAAIDSVSTTLASTHGASESGNAYAQANENYLYEELDYAMIDDNEIAYYLTEY